MIHQNKIQFVDGQLRYTVHQDDELQHLHNISEDVDSSWKTIGYTDSEVFEMIDLWVSLGRRHPVFLRYDIRAGKIEKTDTLMRLLAFSWRLKECAEKISKLKSLDQEALTLRTELAVRPVECWRKQIP